MTSSPHSDEVASNLADKLTTLRERHAGLPEAERLKLLRSALDAELKASPAELCAELTERLKEQLVARAKERSERLQSLEREIAKLRSENSRLEDQARTTAGKEAELAQREAKLREQSDSLEAQGRTLAEQKRTLEEAQRKTTAIENQLAEREMRIKELTAGASEAQEKIHSLETEQQRLAAEATKLAAQRRQLEEQLSQAVATDGGSIDPLSPAAGGTTLLQRLREALRASAEGQAIAAESLPLPEDVSRLFELMQQLLRFSLEFDRGVQAFLMELQIGPAMDTVQVRSYHRQVAKRFCDCLDNKEGSIASLDELLERNRRFLIMLNEAYRAAIPRGSVDLLEELDPDKALAQTKGKGLLRLTNYEEAYKRLSTKWEDLHGLPPSELLVRFFTEAFQDELRRRVD